MAFLDRLIPWRRPAVSAPTPEPEAFLDLPLRRAEATEAITNQRQAVRESISLGAGLSLDPDDHLYRRLTSGAKFGRRDLSPLQQDRMIEICWYLWEQNPFARRLITMMTDLILGEGITVEAGDERIQGVIDSTWNHRVNQLKARIREFHNAVCLNGELILPAAVNPITGTPTLGFLDPYQVKAVHPDPTNILLADQVEMKPAGGAGEGQRLKIIRENPGTGLLEGEVFYFAINKLPNSLRGRSDLMPLADWLDLYDQYLFAEVERLHLLSSFVWDLKMEGADQAKIDERLRKFPTPRPGSVFGHNEKESLDARTPELHASDRSEAGRMLRTHIAGSFGFPLSWIGEIDSNRATIEGQNDILLKTPAARQKEFAGFIDQIIRYGVEQATTKNRTLFREADLGYVVRMPEIAAKDIARVGQVLASVVTAMDTGMANGTMSRRVAVTTTCALLKHLGVETDPQQVMDEADEEKEERDEMAQAISRGMAGGNPPVPGKEDTEEDEDGNRKPVAAGGGPAEED